MATTLRQTDILFNDGTTLSSGNIGFANLTAPTVSAGDNYTLYRPEFSREMPSTTSWTIPVAYGTSMSKVLSAKCLVNGSIRIQWAHQGLAITQYSRIYVNGVAQGTEQASGGTAIVYFTQDISVSVGDKIEIWGRNSSPSSSTQIFGINIGISQEPFYCLVSNVLVHNTRASTSASLSGVDNYGSLSFTGV